MEPLGILSAEATDSWENILSELDLADHRQDLAAAEYDNFKARAVHSDIFFKVGWEIQKKFASVHAGISNQFASNDFLIQYIQRDFLIQDI